jgi:hypothetical protein
LVEGETVSRPAGSHLNHHQRETVRKIYAHPVTRGLAWHDVESLLGAIGDVTTSHDDRYHVTAGDVTRVFVRPKSKELDVAEVMELRHFLEAVGVADDGDG